MVKVRIEMKARDGLLSHYRGSELFQTAEHRYGLFSYETFDSMLRMRLEWKWKIPLYPLNSRIFINGKLDVSHDLETIQ
jgi:hypothetical protein